MLTMPHARHDAATSAAKIAALALRAYIYAPYDAAAFDAAMMPIRAMLSYADYAPLRDAAAMSRHAEATYYAFRDAERRHER